MGKNAHPPRTSASKKPGSKSTGPDESSFIVFTNDKTDKPVKTSKPGNNGTAEAGSSKAGTSRLLEDEAPKKPDTRTLIGGASWTGKLPVNMLAEHCQKQKWEKPEYTMSKTPDGNFSSMVILKQRNPKTQETTTLPPFKLPPSHKHLAEEPSALEARHFAATYALFRVSSMKNIHMMMPPKYRDLWKGDFVDLKKEDEANGKTLSYAADPFQAQRDIEDQKSQKEKALAIRRKEQELRTKDGMNTPGGSPAAGPASRGWKSAPKVEMGKRVRRDVEEVVKKHAQWNTYQLNMSTREQEAIVQDLSNRGFRKSHVEEAATICKDREEVLEWLLIHVPEDDLPKWCLPEGYTAGVSFASGDLKREAAVRRLTGGGFDSEACEIALTRSGGVEREAAQLLQDALLRRNPADGEAMNELHETNGVWEEEGMALEAIHGAKFRRLTHDSYEIAIDGKHALTIKFTRPKYPYPQHLPILSLNASLPSYIRLSATRKVLQYAATELLGYQMLFNIVDWLEQNLPGLIENPGKLRDVSTASELLTTNNSQKQKVPRNLPRRHAPATQEPAGSATNMKILADWKARQESQRQKDMLAKRQSLPAWRQREAIVKAVHENQVVIISGETGSGKSTQSVQFILDSLIEKRLGQSVSIICTQPRRISALGLADRVADERCSSVGDEVGYTIRGESKQSRNTKITFVTTGVLLRRLQTSGGSPDDIVAALQGISHVVIDEVHERSLDTDFLLALLRSVIKKRHDLKVILMSATLDAKVFEAYFGGAKIVGKVEISGRTFPVQDYYLDDVIRFTNFGQGTVHEDEMDDIDVGKAIRGAGMGINYNLIASLVQEIDKDLGREEGSVLIFLSGTMEISRTLDALRHIPNLHALPLHASLMPSEQRKVFLPAPRGKRKIIAATNVAETSITIDDVVAVIDTGRVKETRYDTQAQMVKLEEVWASRAACKQRRGRAGRVRAGTCYKLYTRNVEAKMMERPEPEIRRVPLEQLCLSVRAMGIADVPQFLADTLTPPETLAVAGALQLLTRVGALDQNNLTALGQHMAMIPADLRCAKLMVLGALFDCLEQCIIIASILTARSPFVSPQDKREESKSARTAFGQGHGDVIADLCAYEEWCSIRDSSSPREVRQWCDQNFLSNQTLQDISTTRSQYTSSLKEIGFLPSSHHAGGRPPNPGSPISYPVLHALLLSALHPQSARILLPDTKYTSTISGTMALDPESRAIKYLDADDSRLFIHPSSTLFSAQTFARNARFLSYFTKLATSKTFVRELTPCGAYGMLLFGGPIEIDTAGRGLVVDGRVRMKGWARIGVLVSRLRAVLDDMLASWIEHPELKAGGGEDEKKILGLVRKLVELDGLDQ